MPEGKGKVADARGGERIGEDAKLCVAPNGGVPLSEIVSVKLLIEFACVSSGRNENAPLLVLNVALVAPTSSAKVNAAGGFFRALKAPVDREFT
ncbi:MAG: hypothetical protein P4N60_13585 [Verrucomicrobiae bacterium]|nr:hypothetical protein [Verrucomicrobiae bacterium]